MKNRLFYNLGNAFIVASLAGFVYLSYPLFSMYFFPPQVKSELPKVGTFITIPKINAQAPVVENVDPWKESVYKEALKNGVAHATDSNFYFAHSSGMPWEVAKYNTVFLRLGELHIGDIIIIERDGKPQKYKVSDKKEVWPTEVEYLKGSKNGELILQTCTPIGTSIKRLLVFAKPTS